MSSNPSKRTVPYPALGYTADLRGYYGVAFSCEDATELFSNIDATILVYCIDLPRAELCTNVVQAMNFFEKGAK